MGIKFNDMADLKKFIQRCLVEGDCKDTLHSRFYNVSIDFLFKHVSVDVGDDCDVFELAKFLHEKKVNYLHIEEY